MKKRKAPAAMRQKTLFAIGKSYCRVFLLQRLRIGKILWRLLVEIGGHFLRRRRDAHGALEDDVFRGDLLSVDSFVGVVVWTNGGTSE
jgi:hypothetical protein